MRNLEMQAQRPMRNLRLLQGVSRGHLMPWPVAEPGSASYWCREDVYCWIT